GAELQSSCNAARGVRRRHEIAPHLLGKRPDECEHFFFEQPWNEPIELGLLKRRQPVPGNRNGDAVERLAGFETVLEWQSGAIELKLFGELRGIHTAQFVWVDEVFHRHIQQARVLTLRLAPPAL